MRFFRVLVMGIAVLGFMTMSAQAGTIDLIVNAYASYEGVDTPIPTKCTDGSYTEIVPGSIITYEIAVAVDDSAESTVPGNRGLATIVFDVERCFGVPTGYTMNPITAAESGFAELPGGAVGALRDVTNSMYVDSGTTAYAGYNGGWGFDNSGLPIGGNVTASLGDVLGAGSLAPLTWTADVNPSFVGNQPYARLDVGIGTYMFGAGDPAAGGLMGGFGQDLSNSSNVIPGDGSWLMFRGTIDTSGWADGAAYGWEVNPTNGAVYTPTLDYGQDQGGGFRIAVNEPDMDGDSFAFFLVPEPASLGLLLVGGMALIRRRR
jgi:hypothetical protein